MLSDLAIEKERVRLEWISAAEGEKVKKVINEMTEKVRVLGMLGLPRRFEEWDREMEHLESEWQERVAAAPLDHEDDEGDEFTSTPVGVLSPEARHG
jgi:hypothetical protein